jgi:hypothetical protein
VRKEAFDGFPRRKLTSDLPLDEFSDELRNALALLRRSDARLAKELLVH